MTRFPFRPGRGAITTLAAAIAFSLCGCGSSTQLVNLWKDPDLSPGSMHSFVVVAMRKDPALRRLTEDAFVTEFRKHGAEATASYTLFPDRPPAEERLRQRLEESHYDGILFVRPAGASTETHYVPGYSAVRPVYYRDPFWRTYGYSYQRIYRPGYIERDRVVRLDISLWSTGGDGQLVWTATSRTLNPSSVGDLGTEVSQRVVPELERAGVLPR